MAEKRSQQTLEGADWLPY